MVPLRPIPRLYLNASIEVREIQADGTFAKPYEVAHVRYDGAVGVDTDMGANVYGKIYMDALRSTGAKDIPVGSRITLGDHDLFVRSVKCVCGAQGRIHHWEVEVS